jgi:uncharacterized membrane protein YgdD (TMEM256/DUF423 family)
LISTRASAFSRRVLATGAVFALLAVMSGAFAAHVLETVLGQHQLGLFETAARYQMYHALALSIVGLVSMHSHFSRRLLQFAALAFVVGIILFSGSLYLLALSHLRWPGMITPLGGIAFLAGWLSLIAAALKQTAQSE